MSENTHRLQNPLLQSVYNHIWFPKNTREGYFFRYGSAFILGFLILPIFLLTPPEELLNILFPIFFLLITIGTLLGNAPSGMLLTFFSLGTFGLISYIHHHTPLFASIEMFLLGVTGLLISVLIPYTKRLSLITEYNKKEKELERQLTEVSELKEKAEQEIKLREEFISIASHELKTPLTTTLLKLQTALHNVRNVSLAQFSVQNLLDMLESAEQQTQRLSKMINDLLNVSLIRTGRLELEIEECDIAEITRDVVSRFHEKAERDNTPLSFSAEEKIMGKCDRMRLEQVIANLLSNAMKYGKGTPISVIAYQRNNTVFITITDQGIGISKENIERIFSLFERAVNNNQYKGLGIGLYITSQIVKAHNGRISVKSKENAGSEFTVEIPL